MEKNQSTPIINQYVALIRLDLNGQAMNLVDEKIEEMIKLLNLNVVKRLDYSFSPAGKTLAYILSESHLVVHTWPEFEIIHIDLTTCSHQTRDEFEASIHKVFNEDYKIKSAEVKTVLFD